MASARLESMARLFRRHKPPRLAADIRKRAAVLVCLFEDENDDLRVILTKRTSTRSTYSGEVSLPGGKVEEGDQSYVETALREAEEEIGLDPRDVTVVAILAPFIAKVRKQTRF